MSRFRDNDDEIRRREALGEENEILPRQPGAWRQMPSKLMKAAASSEAAHVSDISEWTHLKFTSARSAGG